MKKNPMRRKAAQGSAAALLGLALSLPMAAPPAQAYDVDLNPSTQANDATSKIGGSLAEAEGTVEVFVQFRGNGAYESTQPRSVLSGESDPVQAQAQVEAIAQRVESQTQQVATQANAEVIYTTHNALRGTALRGNAEELRALAQRSDVVRISRIVPKERANGGTAITTEALNTWVQTGKTGKDVTIAVIDSGVDYTHAAFGGPGTVEAYNEAKASADMPAADSGLYDPEKFVGGYDLAGDDYLGSNAPKPDNNPLDCTANGHGTHVAGSAAGFAVNADGSTFRGDYTKLTQDDVLGMKIGPGAAPEAKVVGLRVFGCDGSTNLTGQALDRVLDPNGDGDFSDKADIVNLSLGADFGAVDDPENYIIDSLYRQGVLSVIAAGNANSYQGQGDTYSILGTPGNTISALTVANSIGTYAYADKAEILSPANIAGPVQGDYSINFNYAAASEDQLTGEVVMAPENNRYGCEAFPAGTDFNGKWVWIDWAEDLEGNFPCGSTVRFNNIEKAGGAGVVLASKVLKETSGIAGNSTIPGVRLTVADAEKALPAAQAGTLRIKLDSDWIGKTVFETGALDTLNSSSGRGQFGVNGFTKPDVAAPGTSIRSAGVGLGSDSLIMTGTSMSSPHVAGIAALVLEAHQNYGPAEIKAAIMNTANHDLVTDEGNVYSVERVGSGRVDALAAVNTDVLVYNSNRPEQVSTSFGAPEVPVGESLTISRNVTVENYSDRERTFKVALDDSSTVTGATISAPSTVTVPAGGQAEITLTATLDGSQLTKDRDPAALETHKENARQYLATVSSRLILTEGDTQLRVPVQVAPKPVADMKVANSAIEFGPGSNATEVTLSGTELNQGGYRSAVGAFQLGVESPRIPTSSLGSVSSQVADLMYAGANSTAPVLEAQGEDPTTGYLNIGIASWANWATINRTWFYEVDLDVNGDGRPEFFAMTTRIPGIDLPVVNLYKQVNGQWSVIGSQPVNGTFGDVDTNLMGSNTLVMPLSLEALNLTSAQAQALRYKIYSGTWYHNGNIESTEWVKYNPYAPDLYFSSEQAVGTSLFVASPANTLTAHRAADTTDARALFLHMHNATGDLAGIKADARGDKAQVVNVSGLKTPATNNPRFTDVPTDHVFYNEIAWLANRGITTGWSDGTFRPYEPVKRDQMAAFFYRMAGSPQYTPPAVSPFSDVPTDYVFYKEIAWMAEQGITTGWPDGTFRPADPVNRDQMAAFFYRMAGSPEYTVPANSPFKDLSASEHVFYKEIAWMAEQGITTGWPDGTFRPYDPVNRDQMAAFIYRFDQKVLNK
ncbi:S8 family serine peptidase [Rothia nasimurium]|nr:S8 family serine peptidase [Rothia nasimurium]